MASRLQIAMSSPTIPPIMPRTALSTNIEPHQTPAACAHRGAHRQFFAAGKRARELQVGDIGAGDEEHAADGDEKEIKISAGNRRRRFRATRAH